jgi:hypothetical protein
MLQSSPIRSHSGEVGLQLMKDCHLIPAVYTPMDGARGYPMGWYRDLYPLTSPLIDLCFAFCVRLPPEQSTVITLQIGHNRYRE